MELVLARHKMDMERAESRRKDRQQNVLEREQLLFPFVVCILLTPMLYVLPEKDYLLLGASAAPLTAYVSARGIQNWKMLTEQLRRARENGD